MQIYKKPLKHQSDQKKQKLGSKSKNKKSYKPSKVILIKGIKLTMDEDVLVRKL